jgi:hypothetical protein
MSDEQRRDDETEVEGHQNRVGVNEEPADDDEESEVEAHIRSYPSARMD